MIDQELEKAIDEAGREKVFAIAKANGWDGSMSVPKGFWWDFCRQAKETPPICHGGEK